MWTLEQRKRINLEGAIIQSEGLTQFSLSHDPARDSYHVSGYASSSSGRRYGLCVLIPDGYPYRRPPMYLTDPNPLYAADGTRISARGICHDMHTLEPLSNGMIQL